MCFYSCDVSLPRFPLFLHYSTPAPVEKQTDMKIWVMFSLVGAAFVFFSDGGITSDSSDVPVSHQVDETESPASDDVVPECRIPWLEVKKNQAGSVTLEDYQPMDPSPSSKTSVKPGPIEHGVPLMPYLPNPAPPACPPEQNG